MSEQHRRECEAREWLRRGYVKTGAVNRLMKEIKEKRGAAAAERLWADMKEQWARRADWLS